MICTLLLALLPVAPQAQFEPPSWQLIDGVALHIDGRIVLFSELEQAVLSHRMFRPDMTQAEFDELHGEVIREFANQRLEIQAGQNEGFDPERIAQIAAQETNKKVDQVGVAQYSNELRAEGAKIEDRTRDEADELYIRLWRSKILGRDKEQGFSERSARDRYIRPGMLKSIFRVSREMINPGEVVFRFFLLDPNAVGGDDPAIEYLTDIQKRVAAGEAFENIISAEASQSQANGGLQDRMAIPEINLPELQQFAIEGEVGSFGPIIHIPRTEQPLYLLARLEDRESQVEPDFEDGELQNRFRRQIEASVDFRLIDSGHRRLRRGAHIWVHPRLGPQSPDPKR